MLNIEDLFVEKNGRALLEGISLQIPAGSTQLLLGKSGSGKTTLLRAIAQLEKEYRGQITFEGAKLSALTSLERARLVGFVPQSYALFPHRTLLENCAGVLIDLFRESKARARCKARQMLEALDMGAFGGSYPHELSGGQQQRAAIARALLVEPRYLLLDEPTSALDPESTARLVEILLRLKAEGRGLIIASQDMAFAKEILDSALFLEEGRIVQRYEQNTLLKEGKIWQYLCQ